MTSNRNLLIFLFTTCMLAACDGNRIFEENREINGETWKEEEVIVFETQITDTLQPCNLYINVRHASFFPFRNLFLFVETTLPDQEVVRDTVELALADEAGVWKGSGLGDLYDVQELWKKSVTFPLKGKYRFSIQQAMRMEALPLIMDVGLRIEKAGK